MCMGQPLVTHHGGVWPGAERAGEVGVDEVTAEPGQHGLLADHRAVVVVEVGGPAPRLRQQHAGVAVRHALVGHDAQLRETR